jgi:hypothetical protein
VGDAEHQNTSHSPCQPASQPTHPPTHLTCCPASETAAPQSLARSCRQLEFWGDMKAPLHTASRGMRGGRHWQEEGM